MLLGKESMYNLYGENSYDSNELAHTYQALRPRRGRR